MTEKLLQRAEDALSGSNNITYPSRNAAQHMRAIMRELVDALRSLEGAERLVLDRARRWRKVIVEHGAQLAVASRLELMQAIEQLELLESRKNPRNAGRTPANAFMGKD